MMEYSWPLHPENISSHTRDCVGTMKRKFNYTPRLQLQTGPKLEMLTVRRNNTLSIQSTLQLAKGDQVRIFLLQGTTHDVDGNNFTNYVGWLLEEDIN